MMDLATIREMSQEAAQIAAEQNKQPFVIEQEDLDNWPGKINFPFIGDYEPPGWKQTDTLFVDTSGFGREGEMALTWRQLKTRLKIGYGYATIEAGQFQAYLGEFKKTKTK